MPAVSVVIPTHNRAELLRRAIDSVLEQTFTDFEVIVVDDASTDRTSQVVHEYSDDRLRYIRFEENQGANAARNAGIRAATGNFVSFLDSDDAFRPRNLEVTTNRLRAMSPECAGVYTSFAFVDDGEAINVSYAIDGAISYEEMEGNPIGGFSAVMLRADVFDEIGMLDEDFVSCQDIDLFLRILRQYTLVGIDKILLDYFVHDERISSEPKRKLRGHEQLLEKHGKDLPPLMMGHIHYARAFLYADRGELRAARREFFRAIRINPRRFRYYYHLGATLFGVQGFEASVEIKQRLNLLRGRITAPFR